MSREGVTATTAVAVPSPTPSPPRCSGPYVLLHFLAQLLALPALRLREVLREKPGQPQRQPVGNCKEKCPGQVSSLPVREITQQKLDVWGYA